MRRAMLALCLVAALGGCSIGGDGNGGGGALGPAPTANQPKAAEQLGFPSLATRDTLRVGGGDAIADLAGTVTAVFPATTALSRPHAVVLVDKDDWQSAVAASVMNAAPLGAPLLASDGGKLPPATADA